MFFVPEVTIRIERNHNDKEDHDTFSLLHQASSSLQEAGLALLLFDDARYKLDSLLLNRSDWEAQRDKDYNRQRELQPAIEEDLRAEARQQWRAAFGITYEDSDFELPAPNEFAISSAAYDLARVAVQREKWQRGQVPEEWISLMPSMHAKSFIYALDVIGKSLDKLKAYARCPPAARTVVDNFWAAFPTLRKIRNSAHHSEQRAVGESARGKIDLGDPPDWIDGPGAKVLVVNGVLIDDRFGMTLEDGAYGEIAINAESLRSAQTLLQDFINTYPPDHTGHQYTHPSK